MPAGQILPLAVMRLANPRHLRCDGRKHDRTAIETEAGRCSSPGDRSGKSKADNHSRWPT